MDNTCLQLYIENLNKTKFKYNKIHYLFNIENSFMYNYKIN